MIMKKIILFFTACMIFNLFNSAEAKYTKLAYEFNFDSINDDGKIQLKNFENKVIDMYPILDKMDINYSKHLERLEE